MDELKKQLAGVLSELLFNLQLETIRSHRCDNPTVETDRIFKKTKEIIEYGKHHGIEIK